MSRTDLSHTGMSSTDLSRTDAARVDGPGLTPAHWRARIRAGLYDGGTAGCADGFVQANVVIVPEALAADFHAYCRANPRPCPLLGMGRAGEPGLPELGAIDMRTDLPRYWVYRHGRHDADVRDIAGLWREDFVTFALGCSFSFEQALLSAGMRLRHRERGRVVPMYRTAIATQSSGPFGGPLVVSMRPFKPADAARAAAITARWPALHGAPVHQGDPSAIGIADLARPDWGDPPEIHAGEIPVFWACGVTPQAALEAAAPEICITHKPGHMLLTDLTIEELMAASSAGAAGDDGPALTEE